MSIQNARLGIESAEQVFDSCATIYHHQLLRGLSVSGETPDFFAAGRISATARLAAKRNSSTDCVLDFGCGVGTAAPYLLEAFPRAQIIGSDIAQKAIHEARKRHKNERLSWVRDLEGLAPKSVDLIYCNGVFHHIPPKQRDAILRRLANLLRPGGYFALWENNPWNPGTRWVMRQIEFDRHAVCLSPLETWQRLTAGGLNIRTMEHHFFFPRCLGWFRVFERAMRLLPVGAQYVVLAARD